MQEPESFPYIVRPKVLLVDDREDNLLAYEVVLRAVDCDLVKASSGVEAIEHVKGTEFAAVLLDVQMPGMDGFETARALRKLSNGKLSPILFITAGIHDGSMLRKAYDAGAIDFLPKPIESDILCSKVRQFIELFQARQIMRSHARSRTFLSGEGELPKLILEKDWSATPLGELDTWPQSLRTAVGIVLQSRFPMFISWGPQRVFLYNDAYVQILGKKHPTALGNPFHEVWSEVWPDIQALVHKADRGESSFLEDMKLVLNRFDYDEEAYFTFSYSPLRGESGKVEGFFCCVVETTERKKSEDRVKIALSKVEKSERTLDQIFNESPSIMALFHGPQHVFVRANKRYLEVTGRSDLFGKTVAEALPEISEQGFVQILDEVYRTGAPYKGFEVPVYLNKPTGREEKFFDFVYQPLMDPDGRVFGIISQGTDVTYQVVARRKIEESDRDLRMALESARMGTWRVDLLTNTLSSSSQMNNLLRLNGAPQDLYDVIRDGLHPDDQAGTIARLQHAIANNTPYIDEYRAIAKSGETRWFSSRGSVVYDSKGQAVGLAGVTVDITDRKLAQVALERNARLVEAMPQPFFAVDKLWTIIYWNPAASEVLGVEASEVLGKNLWTSFPGLGATEFGEAYRRTMTEQTGLSAEAYYPDFDAWYQSNSFPFDGGIAVAFLDISAQKHTEKVLADARREAEKASELKSAFLANMSHEIRTPLGAMIGFADLLKDPTLDETERSGYIEIITRNGNQLAHLINDILDLSKVESGHLRFEIKECNIKNLVNDVVSLLIIGAKEKDLTVEIEFAESVAENLQSDPTRLKQILFNVVGNAMKFTHAGSIALRVFEVATANMKKLISIEVKDTGIGIPEDKKARLFQVFSQADESITRKYGGTGLGLALSKRLANGLGGDVILKESREGHGSTFLIMIQNQELVTKVTTPNKQELSEKPITRVIDEDLNALNILLVEDSPDNQELILQILARRGAKVELAENGQEGVALALRGHHDIVLMDIQMPLMDGYTATQRLREQGFAKPIIALTAHAMSEVRQKCLQVGCSDHLPKPINAMDLVNLVSKLTKL